MKIFGLEFTFNGFDVFHKGNQPYIDELNKKILTISTTAAGYYTFAQTPINPGAYSGVFKITVTSTANNGIGHVMYVRVEGHTYTVTTFQIDSKSNNTTPATTGLYYLRAAYPKNTNNGYGALIEFYVYDATKRDITIELIESENLDLLGSVVPSTYNSTYQYISTPTVIYNGIITNQTFYGTFSGTLTGGVSGNATSANYLYNSSFVAGEALNTNDIIFLASDNKWYKCSTASRVIPMGTMFARCGGGYSTGATVGAYVQGYFAMQSGTTGTKNVGKDLFVRGQMSGLMFTTDGNITTEIAAGYSYVRIGSVVNTTSYLNYDGNNRVYTTDANGNLIAMDGINFGFPTKLSQLQNDIGAGGGVKIITDSVEPTSPSPGDFWYKVV